MAKVESVFNFLKDYNELSNPVITEIDKQNWYYRFYNVPKIKEVWSVFHVHEFDELKILEVKRPNLNPCPSPDKLIINWLDGDWNKLNVESVTYKESIIKEIENADGQILQHAEYFDENKDRVKSFENWTRKREYWRKVELPKQVGLELYNNLYKLYSDIKKQPESVELILGDGHIKWRTDGINIDHPVLLQKVNLEFNPDEPSFIITCEELKTELYTPMLRIIPSINQIMLSEVIQEIEDNIFHIADTENIMGFFQRLISVIDEKGKCVGEFEKNYDGPMIKHNPILFLRKRNLGYSIFVDKIIEDIKNNDNNVFPDFLENMVGNYKENKEVEIIGDHWNQNGIDKDILLTLPANNEQLKIIKHLDNYGSVLVQGPPGTGKTHTIANLIGHLLSEGKNVLVTSHTEKALMVLKDKVYKKLQSLCISLLSSSSQRKEMDISLFEIAEKNTSIDLNNLKKEILKLEQEREDLVNKYKIKNQELIQIRSLEYKDIVFANETIHPIEAAKFIREGKEKYNYIPGKSKDDTASIPLSAEELTRLYNTNDLITLEEEKILSKDLPHFEDIWASDDFNIKSRTYFEFRDLLKGRTPKLKIKNDIDKQLLLELLDEAKNIKESLDNLEDFQYAIISISIKDQVYTGFWEEVFAEFDELMVEYKDYRRILFENNFYIPEEFVDNETVVILDEIINSKKETPVSFVSGLLKPKWRKIRDSITNNNKTVEKREDYCNIKTIISYKLKRSSLINKINKLLSKVSEEIDFNTQDVEILIENCIKKVQLALNWYESNWIYYKSNIQKHVVDLNTYDQLCELDIEKPVESIENLLDVFIEDLDKKHQSILLQEIVREFDFYEEFLIKYQACGSCFDGLVSSVKKKDIAEYEVYYEKLKDLYSKRKIYLMRVELLEKLGRIAPDWVDAVRKREGIHGKPIVPEDINLAWKWNQLNNQINRINSYDSNSIQKELNKLNEYLMKNARELAYKKAWFYKIRNNTPIQTQAIEGWRQTMKQVGKGTGKTAPMLLEKARKLMPFCQAAIPVWIMPLNRVAENFDPQRNRFDVVIIDEASQADILALTALYLGKKIIIVGDDEQVSPDSVGIKAEEINALIEQHLHDVPLGHLFNGKTSVYDMAKSSGFKPIMLTEHFRCLPEIIEFSNQLSYNGKIKPLRDASNVKIKPSVVEYRVPNGYRTSDKVNKVEAEYIASLICACVEREEYEGKTIGVISLLGKEQAYEIDTLLQRYLDPREYEDRRIQCGSPAQFQGDERDIIFLSVVESPSERGEPVRLVSPDGRNDMYRKRYNVAASRAKDQMWVVHSLNPEIDLKPDDIRLRLIKYAMNPSIDKSEEKLKVAESDFEEKVMQILLSKGYKVD